MSLKNENLEIMTWTTRMVRLILPAISGSLLFLSDYPAHLWPLQLLALLPWLWVLSPHGQDRKLRDGANPEETTWLLQWWPRLEPPLAGLLLGLFYTVPLLIVTAFPWIMAVGLGLYITGIWIGLSIATARVLRWPGVLGALGAGAAAVLAEWIGTHGIPVWGTAQSFVRVWSAAPWAIQFIDLTGTLGIVFVIVVIQAIVIRLVRETSGRRGNAITLALMISLLASYNAMRWFERPTTSMKVAAVGWVSTQLPQGRATSNHRIVNDVLLPMFHEAAEKGAVLIVSPEAGFEVDKTNKEHLFEPILQFASKHQIALAVGYFDNHRNDNRIAFIDDSGVLQSEYRKSHLIPMIEDYQSGDGTRVSITVQGHRVGGMICQDDNFTDISSGYGRDALPIVAVPTNDWRAVKDYHFENSRMRPMENRYAIVRASTNGVSAIVSARGQILSELDHYVSGPGVVVADLPLFRPGSLHARGRHAFPLVCGLFLLGSWVWWRKYRTSPQVQA